jgi:hypothetical protein
MSDLAHANLGVAQSDKQPLPPTIAAAATIAPATRFMFLTGTTSVANITPPTSGYCEVILCFTDNSPGAFATNGSDHPIKVAYQPIVNRPILMCYDPISNYWWPAAVV